MKSGYATPGDEQMIQSKTNLFLIGAHKAGTTSLYEMLAQHHGIDAPEIKEPGFFSIDGRPDSSTLAAYDARYSPVAGERVYWMDGSTSYAQTMRYTDTIDHISEHCGNDLKFIYVVRDPIDRMISAYVQLRSERMNDLDRELSAALPRLMEPCFYRTHYDRYAVKFGAENILVLTFDHLRADSAGFVGECFEFLGLDHIDILDVHANAGVDRSQNNRFLDAAMKLPGASAVVARVLDSRLERAATRLRHRMSVPVEKPDITPETLGDDWPRISSEAHGILEVARGPKVEWQIGVTVA